MQAKLTPEHGFQPFSLELKVETEHDARALYHLFNHARNCDLFADEGFGNNVRELINHQLPDVDWYSGVDADIVPGVKYRDYYK